MSSRSCGVRCGTSILGGQRYGILGVAVVLLAGLRTVLPVRTANPVNGETAMASRAARHCSVLP